MSVGKYMNDKYLFNPSGIGNKWFITKINFARKTKLTFALKFFNIPGTVAFEE